MAAPSAAPGLSPVAEKLLVGLDEVRRDEALWVSIGIAATGAAEPVFTELYLGGVRAALRLVARARRKDDDPDPGTATASLAALLADLERYVPSAEISVDAAMYVRAYTTAWWRTLETTTRRELARVIVKAREEGWSIARITDEVEPLFGAARAEKIAVTETTRLMGAGAQQTYRQIGVTTWDWRTVEDSRVDQDCIDARDGSPYSMDIDFVPKHVMCRCFNAPTVGSVPEVASA